MASTGSALSGKFHVSWAAGGAEASIIEHVGDAELPSTIENEVTELVSDLATRKEIVQKGGYDDTTVTAFFNPATYEQFITAKTDGTIGTLSYECEAADGGKYNASYTAQVVSVGGPSGDVEGVMESFEITFGIKSRVTSSGSLGTQVYE